MEVETRAWTPSTVSPILPCPCYQDQCMLSITALLRASAHAPSLNTWLLQTHEAAEVRLFLSTGTLHLQITAPPCSFRQFPLSISNSTQPMCPVIPYAVHWVCPPSSTAGFPLCPSPRSLLLWYSWNETHPSECRKPEADSTDSSRCLVRQERTP